MQLITFSAGVPCVAKMLHKVVSTMMDARAVAVLPGMQVRNRWEVACRGKCRQGDSADCVESE